MRAERARRAGAGERRGRGPGAAERAVCKKPGRRPQPARRDEREAGQPRISFCGEGTGGHRAERHGCGPGVGRGTRGAASVWTEWEPPDRLIAWRFASRGGLSV